MMLMPMVNSYVSAAPKVPLTYALTHSGYNISTAGVPIGDEDPSRVVVVIITQANGAGSRGVSAATVNGNSMNIVKTPNGTSSTAMLSLLVPTGTTADFVITFNGGVAWRALAFFSIYNATSDSVTGYSGGVGTSYNVAVQEGGLVLAGYGFDFGGYTSISGVAEDVNVDGKLVCGGHEVLYDNATYNVSVVGTSGRDSLIVGHFS